MDIEQKIARLEEIVQWQDENIDGVEIPADDRTRIVVGLLDLALEHERAIGILSHRKMHGSVFALSRPLYEAYIRALWLRYCATDNEIEKFKKGKLEKTFSGLIAEIEKVQGYDENALSDIKSKNWKLMNDFTHGGISQAWGRNTANEITPNYPEEDTEAAVDFAVIVGLLVSMEVANITSNETFARQLLEKMESL